MIRRFPFLFTASDGGGMLHLHKILLDIKSDITVRNDKRNIRRGPAAKLRNHHHANVDSSQ